MAKQQQPAGSQVTRVERILAYMFAAAIGLSILAIVALLIANATGNTLPPIITVLPTPGLILAVGFLIALIIVTAIRKGRESKDARS